MVKFENVKGFGLIVSNEEMSMVFREDDGVMSSGRCVIWELTDEGVEIVACFVNEVLHDPVFLEKLGNHRYLTVHLGDGSFGTAYFARSTTTEEIELSLYQLREVSQHYEKQHREIERLSRRLYSLEEQLAKPWWKRLFGR